MSGSIIRISIFSRYILDQASLAAMINSLPGLVAVPMNAEPPPHVIVWDMGNDFSRPPGVPNGTRLIALVPDIEITTFPSGMAGLISKNERPEALGIAIRQVVRGEQYLSASLAIAILRGNDTGDRLQQSDIDGLPEREREVFELLATGLSNKAIAARLYISVRTVEGHLNHIYTHLGVHSRTEAMALAMRQKTNPSNR
jgi:DNA-binding CsgD family transcriptional regulator